MPLESSERMGWPVPISGKWPGQRLLLNSPTLVPPGYADSAAKARIQAVMNKFKRLGFLSEEVSFVHICQEQDNPLFTQILSNEHHVLHQLLPLIRNIPYSLRPRVHDYEPPVANNIMRKNFITSMLYNNTFWFAWTWTIKLRTLEQSVFCIYIVTCM